MLSVVVSQSAKPRTFRKRTLQLLCRKVLQGKEFRIALRPPGVAPIHQYTADSFLFNVGHSPPLQRNQARPWWRVTGTFVLPPERFDDRSTGQDKPAGRILSYGVQWARYKYSGLSGGYPFRPRERVIQVAMERSGVLTVGLGSGRSGRVVWD